MYLKRLCSVFCSWVVVGGSLPDVFQKLHSQLLFATLEKVGSVPSQEDCGMKPWQMEESSQCAPWRPNMDTEPELKNSPLPQRALEFCRVIAGRGEPQRATARSFLTGWNGRWGLGHASLNTMLWKWGRQPGTWTRGSLNSAQLEKPLIPSQLETS